MVCNHRLGDFFELSGENLSLPPGQSFPIYPLAALLPLLPAKQRPTDPNDWMTTDTDVACPDPHCGAVFRITRIRRRTFRHDEVTAVPLADRSGDDGARAGERRRAADGPIGAGRADRARPRLLGRPGDQRRLAALGRPPARHRRPGSGDRGPAPPCRGGAHHLRLRRHLHRRRGAPGRRPPRLAPARRGRRRPPSSRSTPSWCPTSRPCPACAARDVERIVERSLARLGVERLDLVQLHWWDYEIPGFVEAAGWLDDLRRAGKIRHLGATNFDTPHLAALLDAGIAVVSHQIQYSVVDRRPEHGLAELARARGVGLLCYGTLAGGFLSERWLGAPEPEEPPEELANRSLTKYRLILDELGSWELFQELLAALHRIGRRHGVGLSAVALRWVLDRPGVAAAIVGATGDRHLERTLRAFGLELGRRGPGGHREGRGPRRGPGGGRLRPGAGAGRTPCSDHALRLESGVGRAARPSG